MARKCARCQSIKLKAERIPKSGKIPPSSRHILPDDDPVGVFLLGDPAYPLMFYLIKGYSNGGSTVQGQYLGLTLCQSQMVIECAFGRLKTWLGALKRAMDINITDTASVVYSCFVLHNFCELCNETIGENKASSDIEYDQNFQPVETSSNYRPAVMMFKGKN